ncbi:MAG: hypothetical protein WBE34_02705 [Candidatus Nitrosopolaris sp.]
MPYNDTMETAASRVMEEIENYNRLGGLENHLFDTIMQIITENLFLVIYIIRGLDVP